VLRVNISIVNLHPKLRQIKFKCTNHPVDNIKAAVPRINGRILFILNPFGGVKKSLTVYHEIVVPFLAIADIHSFDLIKTEYSKHASEIAQNLDINKYQAIVAISGDGKLFSDSVQ
jgi:Diacylglycerol kinase catalytic domain